MSQFRKSSVHRSTRQRIGGVLLAAALTTGSVVVTTAAAQAAENALNHPPGCNATAGVPHKIGSKIAGEGEGRCNDASQNLTFIYQVHRQEGWHHPNVAQGQASGKKTLYEADAANCDVGSGKGRFKYFGQAFFVGHDPSYSGETRELTICG